MSVTEVKPGSLQEIARELYEAWRGGKADWSKLTPENKTRWYRAAVKAAEICKDGVPHTDVTAALQELQRAGLLGRTFVLP